MNKYHDKKRYMDAVAKGRSHRRISKEGHWSVSSSIIRDELIRDGLIVQTKVVMDKKSGKNHVYYELTGKDLPTQAAPEYWECGTRKSQGNAFDWNNGKISLFTKQDLANARNQGRPANYNPFPITTFSRA